MATSPRATVAILSIGQMGHGIAVLLKAHGYRVISNVSDRSKTTQERARSAGIELVDSDSELVAQADYILSIVPPRDAIATAKRVEAASQTAKRDSKNELWYLDLNAIAPATARSIYQSLTANAPHVIFLDGGIVGGPPAKSDSKPSGWSKPGIPLSGPRKLESAAKDGAHLAETLNTRYLGEEVGRASGLKCCFASLFKGFTALALQSFTTAAELGVLDDLKFYLEVQRPGVKEDAERSIVGCKGKAYRWVEEMNQIGQCHAEEGGFRDQAQVFRQIAGVFEALADVVEKSEGKGMVDADGVIKGLGEGLKGEKNS